MVKKCVGFTANPGRHNDASEAIKFAVSAAQKLDFSCAVDPGFLDLFQGDSCVEELDKASPELIVAIGGDGTILRTALMAAKRDIPTLGVNLGRIGFLSEVVLRELPDALKRIARGDYLTENCMMLECAVNGKQTFRCLNDFILYKRAFSGVSHISIYVDGSDAGSVFADGLIASTPTGSTAYSMSAGGPVIAPGLNAVIITPICPHSLTARPIVASDKSVVAFVMNSRGYLSADGNQKIALEKGDWVEVRRSERSAKLLRLHKRNIYALIRQKLS